MRTLIKPIQSFAKRLLGIHHLQEEVAGLYTELNRVQTRLGDLMEAVSKGSLFPDPDIDLITDHPVAIHSADHQHPRGTAADDTRCPRFCRRTEDVFGRSLKMLDIGCSGGGLVYDFLRRGHYAIGLEGSDYSLRNRRAQWPIIPKHLHTCDVTEPFTLRRASDGERIRFDVIGAWEVLEHIPEAKLPQLLANVRDHLAPDGLFTASVATFEDFDPRTGTVWHVTVRSYDWWERTLADSGLRVVDSPFAVADFPRGSGNPEVRGDWNVATSPHMGFHVVCQLS